jgi:hypothetical protein
MYGWAARARERWKRAYARDQLEGLKRYEHCGGGHYFIWLPHFRGVRSVAEYRGNGSPVMKRASLFAEQLVNAVVDLFSEVWESWGGRERRSNKRLQAIR